MRIEMLDDNGITMLAVVVPGVDLVGMSEDMRDRAMARWLFADDRAPCVSPFLRREHLRDVWRVRPRDRWRARMRAVLKRSPVARFVHRELTR